MLHVHAPLYFFQVYSATAVQGRLVKSTYSAIQKEEANVRSIPTTANASSEKTPMTVCVYVTTKTRNVPVVGSMLSLESKTLAQHWTEVGESWPTFTQH